ncbi:MAG: c-type cytochrome [Candidatus Eisenbacteria bacterium]|nr:c-type cytochrome [Candidatus Eisenbacteria bacterium]
MKGRILPGGLMALGVAAWVTAALAMEPLPKSPPVPAGNPMSAAKVELGKQLFFDPRLSLTGTVSCNSCHNVMAGGEDNRPNSVGVDGRKGGRSAPTVWNAAFMSVQFWDGRASTLEDQAKGPMVNPVEMGMADHSLVIKRIAAAPGYRRQFQRVFGGRNALTIDNVARAIAAYERTLITPNSPVDRYLGGNAKALSAAAVRGKDLVEKIGCVSCHSGPNFAGPVLESGQGFYQKFPTNEVAASVAKYDLKADAGRFGVTKKEEDRNLWRVQTWRNVALTAPYFHNGSVPTLREAVTVMAKTQLDKDLTPAESADIVAFLEGLTGEFPRQTLPRLPATSGTSLVD